MHTVVLALAIVSLNGARTGGRESVSVDRALVETIERWLGTPYQWGHSEAQEGVDCSGFTQSVFQESFGLELPRTSKEQFAIERPLHGKPGLGDLIFFDTKGTGEVNHVGIYMGNRMFVHASRTRGVVYEDLRFFPGKYLGARMIFRAQNN